MYIFGHLSLIQPTKGQNSVFNFGVDGSRGGCALLQNESFSLSSAAARMFLSCMIQQKISSALSLLWLREWRRQLVTDCPNEWTSNMWVEGIERRIQYACSRQSGAHLRQRGNIKAVGPNEPPARHIHRPPAERPAWNHCSMWWWGGQKGGGGGAGGGSVGGCLM